MANCPVLVSGGLPARAGLCGKKSRIKQRRGEVRFRRGIEPRRTDMKRIGNAKSRIGMHRQGTDRQRHCIVSRRHAWQRLSTAQNSAGVVKRGKAAGEQGEAGFGKAAAEKSSP